MPGPPKKYQKIPPRVDALEYDGTNLSEVLAFADSQIRQDNGRLLLDVFTGPPAEIKPGDFIVKVPGGGIYHKPSDEFLAQWEEVIVTPGPGS